MQIWSLLSGGTDDPLEDDPDFYTDLTADFADLSNTKYWNKRIMVHLQAQQ